MYWMFFAVRWRKRGIGIYRLSSATGGGGQGPARLGNSNELLAILGDVPCPFFEPVSIASNPHAAHARLPLIAEHDGLCHGTGVPSPAPDEWRFSGCNHGRDQQHCPRFPLPNSSLIRRFTVKEESDTTLSVLVSEEIHHIPVRWRVVQYSVSRRELLDSSKDACEVAQIRAFCLAYLRRFLPL